MQIKEKSIKMLNTVGTYLKQRFGLKIFAGLSVFLFLFAKGNFLFAYNDLQRLLLLLPLLLIFRLFDDLKSSEKDRKRNPERIYTNLKAQVELKWFLLILTGTFLTAVFSVKLELGLAILLFLGLNILLYRILFNRWRFSYFLPLLKYPFICILLMMVHQNYLQEVFEWHHWLFALSLLPAFILFEALDDSQFTLSSSLKFILLLFCFLPVLFSLEVKIESFLVLAGLGGSYLLCFKYRSGISAYLFLLLLLMNRFLVLW